MMAQYCICWPTDMSRIKPRSCGVARGMGAQLGPPGPLLRPTPKTSAIFQRRLTVRIVCMLSGASYQMLRQRQPKSKFTTRALMATNGQHPKSRRCSPTRINFSPALPWMLKIILGSSGPRHRRIQIIPRKIPQRALFTTQPKRTEPGTRQLSSQPIRGPTLP